MPGNEIKVINERLKELEKRVTELEGTSSKISGTPKNLSAREFLKSSKINGDVQKTLAICYYLETYEELNFFNVNDIKEGFLKAREPVPDKLSDKIYQNVRKGYLMDHKEKKEDNLKTYVLTGSGIDYFENKE